jgi:transcriptional regulator with XRE-family HTH domain
MAGTNTLLAGSKKTRGNRAWARDLLDRAGHTQRDLARAWNVDDSTASRWLDGSLCGDLILSRALEFCRLTGISLEELAGRMGLPGLSDTPVALSSVSDPPLPTVRITPSGRPGKWLFLAHIEVAVDALAGITRALDDAAVNARIARGRASRIAVATAELAEEA